MVRKTSNSGCNCHCQNFPLPLQGLLSFSTLKKTEEEEERGAGGALGQLLLMDSGSSCIMLLYCVWPSVSQPPSLSPP